MQRRASPRGRCGRARCQGDGPEERRPVWYLLANDEGHGFAKMKHQDFQFYASVEYIREFLLR